MSKEMHKELAEHGFRIFALRLNDRTYGRDYEYWIHRKTVEQWREDVSKFRDSSLRTCEEGWANVKVWNDLYKYLHDLGYIEIADVVADVFEGRITCDSSRIIDDPDHDDIQKDGFGHFGHESKPTKLKEERNEN